MRYKHSGLTEQIIGAFYKVYNGLGYGFLEKVYENALAMELQEQGHAVRTQAPIHVYYRGKVVGEYYADLVVDDLVIVELKAVARLVEQNEAQLLNYLKASSYEVGLLLNFGPTAVHQRRAFSNENKPHLKEKNQVNQDNQRPILKERL